MDGVSRINPRIEAARSSQAWHAERHPNTPPSSCARVPPFSCPSTPFPTDTYQQPSFPPLLRVDPVLFGLCVCVEEMQARVSPIAFSCFQALHTTPQAFSPFARARLLLGRVVGGEGLKREEESGEPLLGTNGSQQPPDSPELLSSQSPHPSAERHVQSISRPAWHGQRRKGKRKKNGLSRWWGRQGEQG